MEDKSPLLVPMVVEALVVNDHTRAPRNQIVTFLRAQMDYRNLRDGGNVQPSPEDNDTNFLGNENVPPSNVPASEYYNGVYLKWRLPRAFTSGVQVQSSNRVVYPDVPNRWLVIRYSGDLKARQADAWIVQSDYLYDPSVPLQPRNVSQQATAYTQPNSETGMVYIGRNFALATGAWTEPNTSLKLTAMGPGNPAFAVYQPQCNNVFSFVDCLNDMPAGTLSYQVLGWFSDATDDPLAPLPASVALNLSLPATITLDFTASTPVQVDWLAGQITLPSGVTYAIGAGSTGPMEFTTYLYFKPAVSPTALRGTTDPAAAQLPGCILLATVSPFFITRMEELGWELSQSNQNRSATWTLLEGSVDGVAWQTTELPAGGAPSAQDGVPLSVAVGNTSAEALTALISAQAASDGLGIESKLLDALQLNALDVLDQPDGAAVLAEKLRASFFQRYAGGYVWHIVDAPNAKSHISAQEAATEAAWLAVLNRQQELLHQAEVALRGWQRQLYMMWWKYNLYPNIVPPPSSGCLAPDDDGNPPANLSDQLDPEKSGSLAWEVVQAMKLCASYAKNVPHGDTPAELEIAIADYVLSHALPQERQLKRSGAPSFYLTNNPVVLIAGAGASGIVKTSRPLACRFPADVVPGFKLNGAEVTVATPGLSIPEPALSGLSGVPWTTDLLTALLGEFFFTDPNNAASIAQLVNASVSEVAAAMQEPANALNTYPTGAVAQWMANPWHPLLLFWSATYYPIGYGTPQKPNWKFEGTHYSWNIDLTSVGLSMTLGGLIQLAPTASLNLKSRLQQFLVNNPTLSAEESDAFKKLLDFIEHTDNWDLLSQALDGFNQQLQLGMPGVFLSPEGSSSQATQPSLATLIGDAGQYPPNLGSFPTENSPSPSQFQAWRAGQFEFTNLSLVDEWGQAIEPFVSTSYTKATVYTPPELTPVLTSNSVAVTVSAEPLVASVEPLMAAPAADLNLTVTGVHFTPASRVQWQGAAVETTFCSATQLTAKVPGSSVTRGTADVRVASGDSVTPAANVVVTDRPAIATLSPRMLAAGSVTSDTLAVTASGIGFTLGSLLQWNGTSVDTTVIDATTLVAQVPAQFLFAPGAAAITVVEGTASSNAFAFIIAAGAMIDAITPSIISQNSGPVTIAVTGTGFEPISTMLWEGQPLATTYAGPGKLTALVPASLLALAGEVSVVESVGATVLANAPDPFIQLPPALLQPARLDFSLVSDTGLAMPADPILGWVLPNHLDSSLMAYDALGAALGELSVGVSVSGDPQVSWTPAPNSTYANLQAAADATPHFGSFLLALSQQKPSTFSDMLAALDETLWTTIPSGAVFDQSLAMLVGRPLAFVRARLAFVLDGPAIPDPSWQFTFNPADCNQVLLQTPAIASYQLGVELGNVAQIDDGLIGYFKEDDYTTFNIVQQADCAPDGYLRPIGADGNYLFLPPDGESSVMVSMLVDPRASVHANTALLPAVTATLPAGHVADALAAIQVTFRVDGALTDTQLATGDAAETVLIATPRVAQGNWRWIEDDAAGWRTYPTGVNGSEARLSELAPRLRRGYLQLVSALAAVEDEA